MMILQNISSLILGRRNSWRVSPEHVVGWGAWCFWSSVLGSGLRASVPLKEKTIIIFSISQRVSQLKLTLYLLKSTTVSSRLVSELQLDKSFRRSRRRCWCSNINNPVKQWQFNVDLLFYFVFVKSPVYFDEKHDMNGFYNQGFLLVICCGRPLGTPNYKIVS